MRASVCCAQHGSGRALQGARSYPVAGPASGAASPVRPVRCRILPRNRKGGRLWPTRLGVTLDGLANPAARAAHQRPPARCNALRTPQPPRAMHRDEKRICCLPYSGGLALRIHVVAFVLLSDCPCSPSVPAGCMAYRSPSSPSIAPRLFS